MSNKIYGIPSNSKHHRAVVKNMFRFEPVIIRKIAANGAYF
jgi:hypothetical protein